MAGQAVGMVVGRLSGSGSIRGDRAKPEWGRPWLELAAEEGCGGGNGVRAWRKWRTRCSLACPVPFLCKS